MASLPTPNFTLMQDFTFTSGNLYETKTIRAGSFVRPIHISYVPAHVIEDKRNKDFNKENHEFCYTRYGIIVIPKNYLRRV